MAAPIVNGNVFRMVVIGTVTLILGFYVGMALSPLMTATAQASGFAIPPEASAITSVVDGFLYIPYLVIEAAEGLGLLGLGLVFLAILALLFAYRAAPRAFEKLAGADDPAEASSVSDRAAPSVAARR